jgi:hypothetical protein
MGRIDSKVAFVTGAARGRGRSHALRLAEEGADIVAIDICDQIETVPMAMARREDLEETVRAVEACNRRIVAEVADVRDQGQIDGCAYLLAGVEPGNLCGTSPLDPAILGDKLRAYVESGAPRWSAQYVEVDGVTVLVITVESPKQGDSICTLQKGFARFSAGRIFVRRHGQTEEALPAEVRELERRIRSGRPRSNSGSVG